MNKILLYTSIILLAFTTEVYAQPTNLQESNLTTTSVDLSWVDASCGNAFQFRYRLSSTTSWNPPLTVFVGTDTSLVGLTPGTSYDWKVKCSGGSWSVIESFITLSVPTNGCTDPTACNYDPLATVDDGTCSGLLGCMDITACNYDALATCDDGTICSGLPGCTNTTASNYDPSATCDDGSCILVGPTIDTVFISQPILCNGGFLTDEMQIEINQTAPVTEYSCVIGQLSPTGYFLSFFTTNQTTSSTLNFTALNPNVNYFVRLLDSAAYYNANGGASGSSPIGIYSEFGPINFSEPAELEVNTTTIATNLCFGDCIAEEEIVISGGTQPYNYTLDANPLVTLGATETFDTINALCEGTYSLVVSDANGCLTSPTAITFTINEPTTIVPAGNAWISDISTGVNIDCFGADNGRIENLDLTTGGVFPYSYSLDDIAGSYSTSSFIDSLSPGPHTVYYKDNNGCIDSLDFNIIEAPILELSLVTVTPPTCFGLQDGEISVSVSGGIGSNNFTVDPLLGSFPYSTTTITPLFGDSNYVVTVKDSKNCQDSIHIYMSEPEEILFNTTLSDYNGFNISCFGVSDGSIDISPVSGGILPFDYSIDGGSTFDPATNYTNLAAGTYDLQLKDVDGCIKDTIITLTEPGAFTVTLTTPTPYNGEAISCFGFSDATISTIISNAVNQVLYEFDDNGTLATINSWNSLSSGTYEVYVEDENGCSDSANITINDPIQLSSTSSTIADFCYAQNGEATAFPSGGTGSLSYSWNNGQTSATATSLEGSISGLVYSCTISDQNNCAILEQATVYADIPFSLDHTTTTTCPGQSSGTATVTVTPNGSYILTGPTYLWSNGQSTANATGLSLGLYSVSVTDGFCTIDEAVMIDTATATISIDNISVSHITCHDSDDGQLIVQAVGGAIPYTYSFNSISQGNDSISSNLSEGTYTVLVEDASGCTATQTVDIINPDLISIDSILVNPIACFGECTASIPSIQVSGGTPPYFYSVNGGLTHPNFSYFHSYCADNYTIEVRDVNNCYESGILIIDEPNELVVDITTSLWNNYQIRCNGDSSGVAHVDILGGVSPYNIICVNDITLDTLHNSGITTVNNLKAGTYSFYITDALGCNFTQSLTYFEPSLIQHNFIANHVTCSGWFNGSLLDSVYGGVGNATSYSYLWNTLETTYAINGIGIGEYIIEVTDENNCLSIDTFIINDNNAMSVTSVVTDVSCFDICDGSIEINVTGGIPNINSNGDSIYSYLWNDTLFQTTQTAIGLCADNNSNSTSYTCEITDLQGCIVQVTETITQPTQIIVTTSIDSEIICYGETNGMLNSLVTGGTVPYQYMWSNNSPNYSLNSDNNNVSAGDYVITVKDAKGCFGSDFITLTEPTQIALTISDTAVSCYGFDDGKIIATAENGTPFLGIPPKYLYTVSTNLGVVVDANTIDIGIFEALTPGIYIVEVEDRNGCTVESGTIYISQPGDSLSISFNTIDASCLYANGQALVVVNGGTSFTTGSPYQYNWENGISTANNINLSAGYYPITVIDSRGCEVSDSAFVKGTHNVFADSLSEINFNICLGDSVLITVNETPLNTYIWENGSTVTDRWVYPDDYVNIYTLSITDPACGESYDVFATVNVDFIDAMPASTPGIEYGNFPVVLSGESLEIYSENNNCQNYTWNWDTVIVNTQSTVIYPKNSSWYYINVEDSDGCLGYDSIYVIVGVKPYEAITPNNDGFNDSWTPLDIESYEKSLVQVFNRWGGLVFESSGGASYQPWDGTNEGAELPVGTYYYIIDLNTGDEPQTGPITIIR